MVSQNLKVLAKFGLCSNCSQKLDECSLARACKKWKNVLRNLAGKNARAMNVSGNISFILVLLTFYWNWQKSQFFSKGTRKFKDRKSSSVMMTCRVLPILFDPQSLSEIYGFNWLDPSKASVALNLSRFGGLCGVRSAECANCGVWKMRSVENEECGKCGVWKMQSVENAECGKCGVWKMRSVENWITLFQ